jgi:thymidylate kinase
LKVERRVRLAFVRKVLGRKTRKRLVAGGALVAVVGGDGSGKSSAVTSLCAGLGRDLDVRRFHLGKPPRGLISTVLRTSMRAGRLVGLFRSTRVASEDAIGVPCPGTAWLVWHTLNAHDRRRAYRAARRHATEGGVAICDRYPLSALSSMDGPRTPHLTDLDRLGPVSKGLVALEQRWLRDIRPPDLLLVMSVDPDVAVARRPEQDAGFVRRRSQEVRATSWDLPGVRVIDAGRDHAEVIAEVSAAVWGVL